MKNKSNIYFIFIFILMFFTINNSLFTATIHSKDDNKTKKEELSEDKLQAKNYTGVFDNQRNTVSNIQFYTSNYGIFGFDIARQIGGGLWPRGSQNQYIFAGGFWFAAQKYNKNLNDTVNMVSISYNPNSGKGWFVPGRIREDGPLGGKPIVDLVQKDDIYKYRTFFSIDFRTSNGQPLDSKDQTNWPIWDGSPNEDAVLKSNRYFGIYVPEQANRTLTQYKKGPAFISGEDIFSTYKDTDLNYYEGGVASRRERGYPLMLQVEQMIYSWGFGDYKDFIFLKYEITNYSKDTLWNCWLAPVMDVDIARSTSSSYGAGNDRVKFYECDNGDTLNLALQWSNTDRGELGHGFGYLGFDFLESPAVVKYWRYDTTRNDSGHIINITKVPRPKDEAIDGKDAPEPNFVRKDSAFYSNENQLGLVTFKNWPIAEDKSQDDERYNFMSSGTREGDDGPGDKRFMMATGPFHFIPSDTVRVVVGVILANPAKGREADGTCEDLTELVRKDKFAQIVYDNNFRAPSPPDRAVITNTDRDQRTSGYNHSNVIKWDSTSEMSVDPDEKGLDFMGYKIYRSRRPELNGYSANNIAPNIENPNGLGPFGKKLIAQYSLSPAFFTTDVRSGDDPNNLNLPYIDQFHILGPYTDNTGRIIDSMAIRVMRVGLGLGVSLAKMQNGQIQPVLQAVDTSRLYSPWGKHFYNILKRDPNIKVNPNGSVARLINNNEVALTYIQNVRNEIFDSALVGVMYLDNALNKYNPLFFKKVNVLINETKYNEWMKDFPDGIIGKLIDIDSAGKIVKKRSTTDTVLDLNTIARVTNSDQMTIQAWVLSDWRTNISDEQWLNETKDSLTSMIQKKRILKLDMPDFQQSKEVRENVIAPYMEWITNNRTFIDIGDDDHDGYIYELPNPNQTEKLLNSIEYHYEVIAYDQGDFMQPTDMKDNTAGPGMSNYGISVPTASASNEKPEIKVVYVDSSRIGGLSNFRFFAVDEERLMQMFEGDTLVLKLDPYWGVSTINFGTVEATAGKFGLYRSIAVLTNKTTGDTLYSGLILYESSPCNFSYTTLPTENAASVMLADTLIYDPISKQTLDFGTAFGKGSTTKQGRFFSGDFTVPGYCYTPNWTSNAYGILGFSFDYTMSQLAGKFRGDSATIANPYAPGVEANTPITFVNDPGTLIHTIDVDKVMTTQEVGYNSYFRTPEYGSFNNGPGLYEVEFLAGGTETTVFKYKEGASSNTFNIPYLNVKVRNLTELKVLDENNDTIVRKYPTDVEHMNIDPVRSISYNAFVNTPVFDKIRLYPDPRNLPYFGIKTNEFIGKFNIHSHGFVSNSELKRNATQRFVLRNLEARSTDPMLSAFNTDAYSGFQGKYMMTGISTDNKDTIDFVNTINISGVQFIADFPNKGIRTLTRGFEWDPKDPSVYNIWTAKDFKPGDKIYLRTTGGALGLPMPGTEIIAVVSGNENTEIAMTDEILDQVKVVPNPYILTHQGVKSPYDSKLYFTKLPKKCKIEIYTVAGELVKTLNHDEANENETHLNATKAWDLLNDNSIRVQSQAFIAVITTPNGAQTVKNFSVVVGGFRLLEDANN